MRPDPFPTTRPYTLSDGERISQRILADQSVQTPADHVYGGINFQNLGSPVTVTTGDLIVELSDDSSESKVRQCRCRPCCPDGRGSGGDHN